MIERFNRCIRIRYYVSSNCVRGNDEITRLCEKLRNGNLLQSPALRGDVSYVIEREHVERGNVCVSVYD